MRQERLFVFLPDRRRRMLRPFAPCCGSTPRRSPTARTTTTIPRTRAKASAQSGRRSPLRGSSLQDRAWRCSVPSAIPRPAASDTGETVWRRPRSFRRGTHAAPAIGYVLPKMRYGTESSLLVYRMPSSRRSAQMPHGLCGRGGGGGGGPNGGGGGTGGLPVGGLPGPGRFCGLFMFSVLLAAESGRISAPLSR